MAETRQERRQKQLAERRQHKKEHQAGRKLFVTGDHPALHKVARPVEGDVDLAAIVARMELAVRSTHNGVGLAACQIGEDWRIILLWPRRFKDKAAPLILINPEYAYKSEDLQRSTEGCLSYPGVEAKVMRCSCVTITGLAYPTMTRVTEELSGFAACVAQHEMDHLEGVCVVRDWMNGWRDPRSAAPSLQQHDDYKVKLKPQMFSSARSSSTMLAAALLAAGSLSGRR